jgi:hypothetical protein
MRPSNTGAEAPSGEDAQRWVPPKWLEWSFTALGFIYVFIIFIPGVFNGITIAIEDGHATEAQQIQNTVFIASNLLVPLCAVAYLATGLLFNRMALHLWRVVPLFMLTAAAFVGCAYDSLAHLVPNKSLPLLVEVATRLAPGPMAILDDMQPIFLPVSMILMIVLLVRSKR